eukprot:13781836-Alexandrium_andersonii.AAC.1
MLSLWPVASPPPRARVWSRFAGWCWSVGWSGLECSRGWFAVVAFPHGARGCGVRRCGLVAF